MQEVIFYASHIGGTVPNENRFSKLKEACDFAKQWGDDSVVAEYANGKKVAFYDQHENKMEMVKK